jgi:hypothetical protein
MLSSGNWLKNSSLAVIVAAGLFAASTVNAQGVVGGGGIGGGAGGGAAGDIGGGAAGGIGGIGGNTAGVYVNPDGVFRYKKSIENKQLMKQREQAARGVLNPNVMQKSPLRKISLQRLEAVVAALRKEGKEVPPEMKFLAGLTRITHVFYFPESKEIVIAGPAEGFTNDLEGKPVGIETGACILELQDLIAALRAYPPTGDRTQVISCSIDPTKEGLARHAAVVAEAQATQSLGASGEFQRQAMGMQVVTVKGVSPKSHFAHVLVEADYRMKLIGIGLEKPEVRISSWPERASSLGAAASMQRWFFTPDYDCIRVTEDENAMELVGQGVKLITASELVAADGSRTATKNTDGASKGFVTEFTKKYPELAKRSPIFAQLKNVIDMSMAAAFIQQANYYSKSSWDLGVFKNEKAVPIEIYNAPSTVETAVNVIVKGSKTMTPIGGGVNIQPLKAVSKENMKKDEDGKIDATAKSANSVKGLAAGQWWWD